MILSRRNLLLEGKESRDWGNRESTLTYETILTTTYSIYPVYYVKK